MKRWYASIKQPMLWLVLLTLLHGLWYVAIVHPWQAPDEYLHCEYLRLIDAKRLALTAEDRSLAMQWEVRPFPGLAVTYPHLSVQVRLGISSLVPIDDTGGSTMTTVLLTSEAFLDIMGQLDLALYSVFNTARVLPYPICQIRRVKL